MHHAHAAPQAAPERNRAGDPATILVVDDEPIVRDTLTDMLEASGYRVIGVARGDETFAYLDTVDLVLLDAMLPDRDGWDICRDLKQHHDPLLPVLMVTARTDPEDVLRTFEAGADDYIAKPFNVPELLARIGTRLRAHRTELALQEANRRFQQLAEQNYSMYEQARHDADERAILLRELDHRVRNNLSVILGLVAMERNRRPARAPEEALRSLENRLRAFLLVHDAFRSEHYRSIPVRPLVEQLAQRTAASLDPARRIEVEVRAGEFHVSERQGFALALILNELLSNSYRHAFPGDREGRVVIDCEQEGADVLLEVRDDGIGMAEPPEQAPLGSGRSIIDALAAAELGGCAERVAAERGTRIRVRFPAQASEPGIGDLATDGVGAASSRRRL